jgi:hypothetical protein
MEAALNQDNYELIIDNLLDPMNERFIDLIESNRPVLKGTGFDTGKVIFAKDGIGTFIDGIKSFAEVLAIAENPASKFTPASGHINSNKSIMTAEQLKQDHPETYNSIFNAGIKSGATAEKSRVSAWMAYADADLTAVKDGVKSEETVESKRDELLIKIYSNAHVKNLELDSAKGVITPASGSATEQSDDEKELEALNASIDNSLN